MSPYNPTIHHRHSIRLKGYDYASEGLRHHLHTEPQMFVRDYARRHT